MTKKQNARPSTQNSKANAFAAELKAKKKAKVKKPQLQNTEVSQPNHINSNLKDGLHPAFKRAIDEQQGFEKAAKASKKSNNKIPIQANRPDLKDWLPITKKELALHGWNEVDVVLISGDAYVDHPSFGGAVIGRILQSEGLSVAIIPQPNWRDDLRDFKKFGAPKMFFAVTAGCMDSMVNHYTANRRRRSDDAYTPGGEAGYRPDYATITYTRILKELYPDTPVLIGGIEASLRRVTHYDYWSDKLLPSILEDSQADMLVYGMGEMPLREIVRLMKRGVPFQSLKTIPQTAVLLEEYEGAPKMKKWTDFELQSHEQCLLDKKAYARNFKYVEIESNKVVDSRRLIQMIGERMLVINPTYPTMTEKEIDTSFDLPFTRLPHPKYAKRGAIPAFDMIKFSINMHRGCFGGCSFCTISAHQGKMIASRSVDSILKEVDQVTKMPDFKGYISDLGGPSANMYGMKGIKQEICDKCISPSCIFPGICSNLDINHAPLLEVYKKTAAHPDIKKAFIGSGIRYDMVVPKNKEDDKKNHLSEYLEQVVKHHVSGRLKVAPEHTSDNVLKLMRKPSFKQFHKFKEMYDKVNEKSGLKQQLIPYFIGAHPGSKLEDMANLAVETKDMGFQLEQVQNFTPTPMTVATVIYYSGFHPYTLKETFTARTQQEKLDQTRFFFWYKKENHQWIRRQMAIAKREDLADELLNPKLSDFKQFRKKKK
ncbi:YgiQ family radical SAM protein [bacterium]|nr:YgiQ family radical SAM protein [bacterium]